MDEWMLNDLLECSVCLERLDTSSKVLPCQHTFCKKCLEEIVTTHKELRCPECRVLVDIKIDDLPPNVLLMRILEGMRNAGPKKRNSGSTPGSAVPPPAGNRSANPSHHHMSPPHQLYQQLYHPPTVPQQQQQHQPPPPSLHLQQQQHHLHHLATSVSCRAMATINNQSNSSSPLYSLPFPTNPIASPVQCHNHQLPRFYSPALGSTAPRSTLPATSTNGFNHYMIKSQNDLITRTFKHDVPVYLNPFMTNNNHHPQLFYSFPQGRVVPSLGENMASTQTVLHSNVCSSSESTSSGQCPKPDSTLASAHIPNNTSSSQCPVPSPFHHQSFPGFGSISSASIKPRSQQNLSHIPIPTSSTTFYHMVHNRVAPSSTASEIQNVTTAPRIGQRPITFKPMSKFSINQTLTDTTSSHTSTNGSPNYLCLSNSSSGHFQGSGTDSSIKKPGGTVTTINSIQATVLSSQSHPVGFSKFTPMSTLQNNTLLSQRISEVVLTKPLDQSSLTSLGNTISQSNLQHLAVVNTAPLISPLPGLQHQCNHGSSNLSTSQTNFQNQTMVSNTVSTRLLLASSSPSLLPVGTITVSTITSSSVHNDCLETKDSSSYRADTGCPYSQLADCLSYSSSPLVLPEIASSSVMSEENIAPPPPPTRSESIAPMCKSDTNLCISQPSSVGTTEASLTAISSTAASQSVSLTKGINQPCARAVYDYLSKMPGDLSFKEGDLIILRRKIDNNWYHGECRGQSGVFPLSYVQIMTPLPNHIPQCKALFDFRMNNDDEEGCLTFNKGDVVTVIRRVDENWAEGRLGERIGIFPLAFVDLNNVARALMKLSINSQPGPSRLAPPTPTVDDSTPLIPTDHSRTVSTTTLSTSANTTATTTLITCSATTTTSSSTALPSGASDGSTSTTLTSPSSSSTSSTSSSSSSTTPPTSSSASSPSSPVAHPPPPVQGSNSAVKRHSFTVLQQQQQHNSHGHQQQQSQQSDHHQQSHQHNNRHSAEILTTSEQGSSVSHGPHSLGVITSSSSSNTPVHNVSADSSSSSSSALQRTGSQRRHHQRSASADAQPHRPPPPVNAANAAANAACSVQHASLQLPATYVALYPYKPQKSDELELKRGNVYTVTERCQDGWFKGTNKHQKCGVFPGNYVAPSKSLPAVQAQLRGLGRIAIVGNTTRTGSAPPAAPSPEPRTYFRFSGNQQNSRLLTAPGFGNVVGGGSSNPPELPPRSISPGTISSSWHSGDGSTPTRAHNMSASVGSSHHEGSNVVGRSSPVTVSTTVATPPNATVPVSNSSSKSSEKMKEKKERSSSGGIMRIFSMKKSPPPPTTYSMDNPVFEDGTTSSITTQAQPQTQPTLQPQLPQQQAQLTPVHVRSGSCPSQLLQVTPPSGDHARSSPAHHQHHHHRLFSPSSSQRLKHKERPSLNGAHFSSPRPAGEPSFATPPQHHRKSNSLDAGSTVGSSGDSRKSKQLVPVVRERFRCIVPYPPNSEYELELQLGDVIYVHRKREDGWYKGTQQRTGKTGLFPASFVESF